MHPNHFFTNTTRLLLFRWGSAFNVHGLTKVATTLEKFKQLCQYAMTATPHQTGVSKQDGRTLVVKFQCLLKDSSFPRSMWGELFFATVFLSNLSPNSSLGFDTLFQAARQQRGFGCATSDRVPGVFAHRDMQDQACWQSMGGQPLWV